MAKRKTKYTMRPDGRIVLTKTIDGKRKFFYGMSDAEVERKAREYEEQLAAAALIHSRPFEVVADAWWEEKEKDISPNSVNSYRVAKQRAVEYFEQTPVDEITPAQVYAYLNGYVRKGYSQKIITKANTVLKGILDDALIAGEIQSNPCVNLPPVKSKAKAKKRPPASDNDIEILEQCKAESNISRMFYTMLYAGLRRGEAIALQQKHIDREKKTISVVQSCAFDYGYKPVIKSPKTEAGTRTVGLLDVVAEVIPEYEDPETYVFFPDGLPYKTTVERHLRKFLDDHKINATAHQFRHSYATIGHAAGIDGKDMQGELGHQNLATTMDIYTGIDKKHKEEVRDQLNEFVNKRVKKEPKSDNTFDNIDNTFDNKNGQNEATSSKIK